MSASGTRHSHSNILMMLTALIAFSLLASAAGQVQQQEQKCAEFNQYCQNHWDCCSNSCLSYLNRCTRNYVVFPYTFFGVNYNYNYNNNNGLASSYPQPATLEDLLELNFGNGLRRARAAETEVVKEDEDEVESNKIPKTDESSSEVVTRSPNAGVGVGVGAASESKPSSCSPVGVKCYTNAECCTQRCHGFLHQCVT